MEITTEDYFGTIIKFDDAGDYIGLMNCVAGDRQDINIAIHAVYRLVNDNRVKAAYIIAKMFHNANIHHPILQFSLAVGGIVFNDLGDVANGNAILSAIMAQLPVDKQEVLYNEVMAKSLFRLTEGALVAGDDAKLMRILEILKAGSPLFQRLFDLSRVEPPYDAALMRQRGRERAKLIEFALPPAGAPRVQRRAIVAVRNLFFPQMPNSRAFDVGPRFAKAMTSYGWNATYHPMHWADLAAEFQAVVDACVQEQADVLIFDDHVIEHPASHEVRGAMIAQLRQKLPGLKIVALHLDPWVIEPALMVYSGTTADAIWTIGPALAVWETPALAGRVLHAPFPIGGEPGLPVAPLPGRMVFTGAIKGYNWHRVFWRAASQEAGLPIDWALSHHVADGLSPLDSYGAYLRNLGETGCSLNMSMRPNLRYSVTGRCFETLLSGALLVQELCPDMDHYFVSGEHYLEFTSFADLRAIGEFLVANPGAAETVRRAGNAFVRARYSDDKLIGYLDKHLFYPGA